MPTVKYYQAALSNISQGLLIIGNGRRIIFANQLFQDMLEIPPALTTEGADITDLLRFLAQRGDFGSGDPEYQVQKWQIGLASASSYRNELQQPSGRWLTVAGSPFDADGYVMTVTDITDRQQEQERLAFEVAEKTLALRKANRELGRLAYLDPLLGIPNRRRFSTIAGRIHQQMIREGRSSIVLMVDVDHFKSINDQHGHAVGDLVLSRIADQIRHQLRPADHLARYGGEEFVILLTMTDRQEGCQTAETIREGIARAHTRTADAIVEVTVSIGLSEWEPQEEGIESALIRADNALYDAKKAGRNCCCFA